MRIHVPLLLALLCGCDSDDVSGGSAGPGDSPASDSVGAHDSDATHDSEGETPGDSGTDTSAKAGPEVTEEEVPDHEVDDSWIFSWEVIHEIELTLPESSISSLYADPYTYVPASFTFDGEVLDEVGVRLRGKIGSFRTLAGKPKFKIDFNQTVEDQRFWGLESLSLNNEVVDCSYLKEPIGYELFEAAGVPASRTGFAVVTVNGAPYGLYVVVEVPDDRWLRRNYAEPDGNLYDGKYIWYGGYSYTLLDFGDGVDELFGLEEGTDVGHADISQLSDTLLATQGTSSFYSSTNGLLDWAGFTRMLAVEQYVGQNDGYCLNTNNYRVYFDPESGRADMIPWDLDYSFLYDYQWGLSWTSPRGNLCYACRRDSTCLDVWRDATSDVLTIADDLDLVSKFDDMQALIATAVAEDPRRECSSSSVSYEQDRVRTWLVDRSQQVRNKWGL